MFGLVVYFLARLKGGTCEVFCTCRRELGVECQIRLMAIEKKQSSEMEFEFEAEKKKVSSCEWQVKKLSVWTF